MESIRQSPYYKAKKPSGAKPEGFFIGLEE
jgi:hypothetical protein